MEPKWILSISIAVLLGCTLLLQRFYGVLLDVSSAPKRPFSFSRIQFAWWLIIILSSMVTVIVALDRMPVTPGSTMILLGLSLGTYGAAYVIDRSDGRENLPNLSRNDQRQGILLDILSDKNGISLHRFQALLFNLVFGYWFLHEVLIRITENSAETSLPEFSEGSLMMLGLSSATYAALKANENK